jgi:hypothetical protein
MNKHILMGLVTIITSFTHVASMQKIYTTTQVIDKTGVIEKALGGENTIIEVLYKYKPAFELIKEKNGDITNPRSITIAPHGFGDTKEGMKGSKAYNAARLPGDVIVYNCPEIAEGKGMQWSAVNLGQEKDLVLMLTALRVCQINNMNSVHLRGFSRGGAVTLNALAVLLNKDFKYKNLLDKVGINQEQANKILEMVKRGSVVLECPLLHVQAAIKKQVENVSAATLPSSTTMKESAPWISWIFEIPKKSIATSVNYSLPISTDYSPLGQQGINSIKELVEAKIPLNVYLHVEHNDKAVSNDHVQECYAMLKKINPLHTYFSMGEGSHNERSSEFYRILNTFNRKYGAAYDPKKMLEHDEIELAAYQP